MHTNAFPPPIHSRDGGGCCDPLPSPGINHHPRARDPLRVFYSNTKTIDLSRTPFQRRILLEDIIIFRSLSSARWNSIRSEGIERFENETERGDNSIFREVKEIRKGRKRYPRYRAWDGNGITRPDSKSAIDKHSKRFKGNIADSIPHSANVGRKRTSKSTVKAESGTAVGLKASFGN